MMRAHQPGSRPLDIPEAIPNPAVPRTVPAPSPPPSEPAKVPAPQRALCPARIILRVRVLSRAASSHLPSLALDICCFIMGPRGQIRCAGGRRVGVFAELERSILKERIMAGIARAREKAPRAASKLDDHAFRPASRRLLPKPFSRANGKRAASAASRALGTLRSMLH